MGAVRQCGGDGKRNPIVQVPIPRPLNRVFDYAVPMCMTMPPVGGRVPLGVASVSASSWPTCRPPSTLKLVAEA